MRIDRLFIRRFRNLHDFSIDLQEQRFATVLIGANGTGKSNLLEAIVLIFRDLDLGRQSPFEYRIDYQCRGRRIRARADRGARPTVSILVDDEESTLPWAEFLRRREELLPKYVFAYYSGPSARLGSYFAQHQKAFYDSLLKSTSGDAPPIRRLFFCRPEHSRWVLLAYFLQSDAPEFLAKFFGIDEFDSALLVLKRPPWAKQSPSKAMRELGDDRFWWSRGVVRTFLDRLWDESLAPLYVDRDFQADYRAKARREERLYLYLPRRECLERLRESYPTEAALFAALESTDIADLVRDVRVRVLRGGESIVISEMSEGEQQLLTVVGLMQFTKHDESLFLLDEPDTHLNPQWKLRYLAELVRQVGLVEEDDSAGPGSQDCLDPTSQLILTTHDPLTIAGLEADQVQIFGRAGNAVVVENPSISPRGLGVAGVLTRMFGLPTTLDLPTQEKLDERNKLVRHPRRDLSKAERMRLKELTQELGDLGLVYEARDPLYDRFLRLLFVWESKNARVFEDAPESEQIRIVEELVAELMQEAQ